jgi:serine/threonine protein phosphatase PrpC
VGAWTPASAGEQIKTWETNMPPRFFITHSWKDIEFATRLCDDLRAAGLDGFLDAHSIKPGDSIPSRIERGLKECDVYLPIFSPDALKSDWCDWEIDMAITMNRMRKGRPRIIPVIAKPCSVPDRLIHLLYVDFVGRYDDALKELLKGLEALPGSISLLVGGMTDVGKLRESNEDSLLIETSRFSQVDSRVLGLFAVADGMGSARRDGAIASRMVIETLTRHIEWYLPRDKQSSSALDYGAILVDAVERANAAIFAESHRMGNDMVSTVVAALVVGNQAYIVNVGDSRAYRIASDGIEKITKDHSLVQVLVDRKEIGEDDVYTHPQRNFILRNVGDKPQADLFTHTFQPGEYLLLCSDGLWKMVYPKQRLHEIVTRAPSVQQACQQLVEVANQNGGDDNITVVLIKFVNTFHT